MKCLFGKTLGSFLALSLVLFSACKTEPQDLRIKTLSAEQAKVQASTVEELVKPELHEDLQIRVWATDSLVADPISMRFDDSGRIFYSRTNRRKISEFDIRSHQDWEIASIGFQTVEDRRKFLHEELSPENSEKNEWLPDINQDGSHDWKDLTVEKENVYRLEDTNGDGLADLAQLVVRDFHEEVTDVAGAVLYHEGELFVGVAPDLWKLTDTNGDGLMDTKTSLISGFGVHIGFGGHNMSGLTVGPEGKIYWSIGDIGFNGTDKEGNTWEFPNCGVVARCDTDGSNFEIFAMGVRNTHEFAFDQYGNLISVDNDGDHSGERERIVYLVDGSDSGWRINWQFGKYRDPKNNSYKVWMDENMHTPRNPEQAAYFIPTIENYVNGPTGMLFNPGTALGEQWKNTFFVAEFAGNPARSGIHGFKLKPEGAGFELESTQQLMGGILATGMDFSPDGALYFADWIDGWVNKGYGRIWKMTDTQSDNEAKRKETAELMAQDFSDLEVDRLEVLLGYEDQRIRKKAQFALAKMGGEGLQAFKNQLIPQANQLARIHAIWGISQMARKEDMQVAKELLPFLKDQDPEIRAQAAKWIGDVKYADGSDALLPLLKDENSRVKFFAAEALGRVAYSPAIPYLVEMLEENNGEDLYLRHAGSLALARIGEETPLAALVNHRSKAVRVAAVVALRRMKSPTISKFLLDQDPYIVAEAARGINDDTSIPEALGDLGALLAEDRFKEEPIIRRAINANLRLGTQEALDQLLAYISNGNAPAAMRAEAIAALSTWTKPSVLDRVDGWYRGEIEREAGMVLSSAKAPLEKLVEDGDAQIRFAAVQALGILKVKDAEQVLLASLKGDPSADVREAALKALASLEAENMEEAIEHGLSDRAKNVRIAGLDLIERMEISAKLKADLLAEVIQKQTTEEKQAALISLGKIDADASTPVFRGFLAQMEEGTFYPEIELELAEALEISGIEQLQNTYEKIKSQQSEDETLASYSGSMYGGDPVKGRRIFFQHPTGQCIKCHAYEDFGGNAGPKLNGIANELNRQELLEALIDPSKRLAPGFGVVILNLENEKRVAGIKAAENQQSITVKMGNKPDTVVMKEHILERKDAPSSMPDMKQYLTRREIRDLVSFLATLN
ncbi:HEAT repeat domain-containing protein [Pleomorphovibrio marinus]|uniref:HEAT repeat domain-containing protein n=1 Tax=Pleomorphovibrio marinus TaxID=2164132 RepID=UPI000E0AAD80|nr:HEAT repeat domain-containing protein [Pleomorphovibrio marinus]